MRFSHSRKRGAVLSCPRHKQKQNAAAPFWLYSEQAAASVYMHKAIFILLVLAVSTCSHPPGKLEEVLETGQLRVLTRISPTTFYSGASGQEGPEHDLVQGFRVFLEQKYNRPVAVEFVMAEGLDELMTRVAAGEVHLAAAGLTVTPERSRRVDFGPAYMDVSQHLIYRLNSGRPESIGSISGKQLEVLAGSSFVETLETVRHNDHPDIAWIENRHATVSDLLLAVQEQRLDYTIVDSLNYDVHRYYMPDLRQAIKLKDDDQLAWAFTRRSSGRLQADAREYFARIKTDGTLERVQERYFGHTERFDYVGARTFSRHYETRLQQYRQLFQMAAADTGVDWRLLAAIGYQESHWNPEAISPTGVKGMMMLTRATAGAYGVDNREDAAASVAAGSRYFAKMYKRYKSIPEPDRIWFALAAYNVGYGHVQDARRLARREGLDPDSWLSLKEMLPKLTQKEYYSTVPHGYARGWEPVRYVNNVRTYLEIMNWLAPDEADDRTQPAVQEPATQIASREQGARTST